MSNTKKLDGGTMNKYERGVSIVAGSIVTTAQQLSDVIVNVALALIAVVSAVPEFMGLWETSERFFLSLAVAATGAGVAYVAVGTKSKLAWGIFAVQLMVVEFILAFQGGVAELAYPLVNVVGAAVMSISKEHRFTSQIALEDAKADKDFEREEKRKDNEIKRQLAIEKQRVQLLNGVKPTVKSDSEGGVNPSAKSKESRQKLLSNILQEFDGPESVNKTELAGRLGVTRQTVISDIKEIMAVKPSANGHVNHE
jgi:flagellar biogenesis protein FliO